MKRGFLNNKKGKKRVFYPEPSKEGTQVSPAVEKRKLLAVNSFSTLSLTGASRT
jgi:hypothetical protein